MEKEQKAKRGNYSIGHFNVNPHVLKRTIDAIDERITELEDKAFRTARKADTTRAQQILLLHHLGLLTEIRALMGSQKKMAQLLSVLLNASAENIEYDLSNINKKESHLRTEANYKFLVNAFDKAGLTQKSKEADKILLQIQNKKESI